MSGDPYEYDDLFVDTLLFGTKVCVRCGCELPANTERFARDRATGDGLSIACRRCRNAAEREHLHANHDRHARKREMMRTYRQRCGERHE